MLNPRIAGSGCAITDQATMWIPFTQGGYSLDERGSRGFQAIVREIDPAAPFEWIQADQLNRVENVGVLYLGDVTVANHARLRQRAGLAAFSLCGVTHTTASHSAMDEITNLLREAVTPWAELRSGDTGHLIADPDSCAALLEVAKHHEPAVAGDRGAGAPLRGLRPSPLSGDDRRRRAELCLVLAEIRPEEAERQVDEWINKA